MSVRTRTRVFSLVFALLGIAYGEISSGWEFVHLCAGLYGLMAVVVPVGLLWTEMGPDGVLGRRRRRRG